MLKPARVVSCPAFLPPGAGTARLSVACCAEAEPVGEPRDYSSARPASTLSRESGVQWNSSARRVDESGEARLKAHRCRLRALRARESAPSAASRYWRA